MIANVVQQQWFILRGWLDNSEWGDEPPDPDDVWAVGDTASAVKPLAYRVRLKDATIEGTIQLTRDQLFLDAYLPLVLVLWDGKSIPVPIEPELLVRLTRFIPPRLTWKAPESFSDESKLKLKNSSGGKCKVCDPETPKGSEHSYVAKPVLEEQASEKPKFEATALRAVGQQETQRDKPLALRSQPYRNTFDASSKVLRDEHLYSREKIQEAATPSSSSNDVLKSQLLIDKQSSTSTLSFNEGILNKELLTGGFEWGFNSTQNLRLVEVEVSNPPSLNREQGTDESDVKGEIDNRSTKNGDGIEKKEGVSITSRQGAYMSVDDRPSAVLRDDKPFSLEKTQQPPKSIIHVTSSSSGSLYRYLKNVQLKSGKIASYPRVVERDPDNLNHWYWGYNYKVKEDGSWKSKSLSLPRDKVRMVRCMIERDAPVDEIRASLKVLRDESGSFLEKEDSTDASPDSKKVLRDDLSFSLEKPQASGSLCSYLKKKKLKSGTVASYPRVEGDRDPNNPDHWYWSYCYEVLVDGEWKGRTLSIPKCKIVTVRAMIDSQKPVSVIKAFLSKEKTIKDKGS
ncbi:hypothetical protein WA1_50115 [Scytonema hofmannii PCC 7110]|uniref:Uncharacterized protein n=1 Tax=Scytonema hofmannii PCC 7110 TaxID=128403 RepID=A0A139WR24_9CYAN|nr:hypothetical protein [Scytonema hofmannii]KYC34884.1 hypothetical protein WA1_50115 [Scytonema hofmannii PCC 7110]